MKLRHFDGACSKRKTGTHGFPFCVFPFCAKISRAVSGSVEKEKVEWIGLTFWFGWW
ncbi:hypothetical protein SAMN05216198_0828 [Halopseudomonas litoralis]|uniref:Uncharacterized protein n=1 Tax=Halopseudomonas litoralis TaxID=797277 RepID=A0A1H1N748_9GAMM|nr:hypothetical protein SAMN05216198_0828 [Halopseudomonas litoralis]